MKGKSCKVVSELTERCHNLIIFFRNMWFLNEREEPMENITENGLSLLKKGQKGILCAIFSRMGLILLLLIIQVLFLLSLFQWFNDLLPHILGGTALFSVIMVGYLINSDIDATAKITWLIVIMQMPVFGGLLFWYTQSDLGHRVLKKRIHHLIMETYDSIPQEKGILDRLKEENSEIASLAQYIHRSGCYPVFAHTDVTYFPIGEKKFEEMLIQLEKAKDFIFLEYFIVDEGLMWGKVLEILAKKVQEGVEVCVMYDGTCEFSTLPHDYPKRLKKLGIQCKMFAPVTPFVSTHYNYRDHRKILVIDGHTAFTGGVNLADEYINHVEKFGHWKDAAIMLKGEAVKSFTLMFLQMWNIDEKETVFQKYLDVPVKESEPAAGYVIPYGDCPLDHDKVGERVYMDLLNHARKYVHIMSPYLILDGELETALKFAAEKGTDVILILPGIPDKFIPYALAMTHYESLIESGVKIYEYTPGFVHAKVFVSDDCKAVVGTINLDYRSLYHHFECAAYLYQTDCIVEIEQDFNETLKQCRRVTKETIKEESIKRKLAGGIMKVIAPLL